jgi:putative hydrolase of the HAD superfamily
MRPRDPGVAPKTGPLRGIRAVLFDVYGTLLVSGSGDIGVGQGVESTAALREALQAAEVAVGAGPGAVDPTVGVRAYEAAIFASHRHARARGLRWPEVDILEIWGEVLGGLLPEHRIGIPQLARVAAEYECRVNPVWPMPGMAESLRRLRDAGLLLGIVSNAQFYTPLLFSALIGQDLGSLGFRRELCAWSYRLGEAKPSEAIFRPVLERLRSGFGVEPGQALYIGNDMLKDIRPAHDLGFRTALFAGDQRSLRERHDESSCQGLRPDTVVTRLDQLPEMLSL